MLFAAAARDTTNIRRGRACPGWCYASHLIAQATATLDELTDGRAEVVLGSGNFGLLAQYEVDWAQTKPLSRVKEGVHVIRTLLDDGAITFDGEFFTYSGLFTFARPVQDRLPVKMGSMRGPKSFEVAGEFSDGCHHALSYSREAYEYGFEHFSAGAGRAGKDPDDLDFAAWVVPRRAGLGGGEAGRALDGRDLCLVHAGRAARAERGRPRGAAPSSKPSARGSGQGHRTHESRAGRQVVDLRYPR